MKSGPLPIFLILALYFIHEVNAGKIVGKLESANGPMDRELVVRKANSKYLRGCTYEPSLILSNLGSKYFKISSVDHLST